MSLWGKRSEVIPCGVDLDVFLPGDQTTAKRALGFNEKIKFALFSSAFNIKVKNYLLAEKGFSAISGVQLEEIKNRTREEVKLFLNAAEFLLLTSFSEGSPQIIKEAMACNCPIVATDVGDIREVIGDTEGCYLTSFDPKDVAEKIKLALAFGKRTNGHEKIGHLDNRIIAEKIIQVYRQVLEKEFKG